MYFPIIKIWYDINKNREIFMDKKALILSAILSATAHAQDPRDTLPDCDQENPGEFCKCYGAALKGQNDCTNKAGTHSCGGFSKQDCEPGEYKVVRHSKCGQERQECQKQKGKPRGFFATLFGK